MGSKTKNGNKNRNKKDEIEKRRLTRRATAQIIEGATEDIMAQTRSEAVQLTSQLFTLAMNRTPSIRVGPKRLADFTAVVEALAAGYAQSKEANGREAADRELTEAIDRIGKRGRSQCQHSNAAWGASRQSGTQGATTGAQTT